MAHHLSTHEGFVRYLIIRVADIVHRDRHFSELFSLARTKTVSEFVEFTDRRNKVTKAWYTKVSKSAVSRVHLDVPLRTGLGHVRLRWHHRSSPVTAHHPPRVSTRYASIEVNSPTRSSPSSGCAMLSPLAACTILYNVVDSPVGVVPVTRVKPTADALAADFVVGAGGTSTILEKEMYAGPKPAYDATAMEGIPVGVQIVGKKWEDEKVLQMMKVVDDALGTARGFGPGSWRAQ